MNPTTKAIMDGLARHVVTAAGGAGIGVTTAPAVDPFAGPIVLGLPLGTWLSIAVFLAGAVSSVINKMPDRVA